MDSATIDFQTITPIWTGGARGDVDRLHETGFIGSLRWWFELLVRGVGGSVSDPTGDQRSGFNRNDYDQHADLDKRARLRGAGLCDVSQIFGATGWRRRFRLTIEDNTSDYEGFPRPIKAGPNRRNRGWYLNDRPRVGQFSVRLKSLDSDFDVSLISGLFQFLADWAALGARNQLGFGVASPIGGRLPTAALYGELREVAGTSTYPTLPALDNLFLAAIQVESTRFRETFNLKYDLRRRFDDNDWVRHFVMGTVRRGRVAAKVKMSLPDSDGMMRVWGWIPHQAGVYRSGWNRETVVSRIHDHLINNYSLTYWHELKSPRATWQPGNDDVLAFLRHLLAIEE